MKCKVSAPLLQFGGGVEEHEARLRILPHHNQNLESVHRVIVPKQSITFIRLSECLTFNETKQGKGIVQLECETDNLNSTIFIAKTKNQKLIGMSTDHFTGG